MDIDIIIKITFIVIQLDTNDKYFNSSIQCTFIEPYPVRLRS